MRQKRGIQMSEAFGAVLALVLIAVLVIVGIVIFVSLQTSFSTTATATVLNEAITPDDGGVAVSNAAACGFNSMSVTNAVNGSVAIDAANYSVDATAGTITNLTSEFVTVPWNVNYTYQWGTEACDASDDMVTQFGTYPALIGLVGTIIFLGLVIGVLVASFVFGRNRV